MRPTIMLVVLSIGGSTLPPLHAARLIRIERRGLSGRAIVPLLLDGNLKAANTEATAQRSKALDALAKDPLTHTEAHHLIHHEAFVHIKPAQEYADSVKAQINSMWPGQASSSTWLRLPSMSRSRKRFEAEHVRAEGDVAALKAISEKHKKDAKTFKEDAEALAGQEPLPHQLQALPRSEYYGQQPLPHMTDNELHVFKSISKTDSGIAPELVHHFLGRTAKIRQLGYEAEATAAKNKIDKADTVFTSDREAYVASLHARHREALELAKHHEALAPLHFAKGPQELVSPRASPPHSP